MGSLGPYPSTCVFASGPTDRQLRHVIVTDVSYVLSLTTSNERCSLKRQERDLILTRCQEVQLEPLCLWIVSFCFVLVFLHVSIFPLLKLISLLSFIVITSLSLLQSPKLQAVN